MSTAWIVILDVLIMALAAISFELVRRRPELFEGLAADMGTNPLTMLALTQSFGPLGPVTIGSPVVGRTTSSRAVIPRPRTPVP